jgi:putative NIF3 family GTP cyclohydrolase 1 type 2
MSNPTIQSMIETILDGMHKPRIKKTCDTVKTGDTSQEVTNVVTTFMATYTVIEKAVALGANFIVTHEPTFYTHNDDTEGFEDDPVYQAKRKLIDDNNIVILRVHDHIHARVPDGIGMGLVEALGWEAYADPNNPFILSLPEMTVSELCGVLKEKLGIRHIRMVGDLDTNFSKVAFPVGAAGGPLQFMLMKKAQADVVICGELNEWEVSEYVRDANDQGHHKAILAIGHANSEEPGMAWFANWLHGVYPDLTITHIPSGDPFRVV